MKPNLRKILIIILTIILLILISIIIFNVFFKSTGNTQPDNTNNKPEETIEKEKAVGDSIEEIAKYLQEKYADENAIIEFSGESDTRWLFEKRNKSDNKAITIYAINKSTKVIVFITPDVS